MSLRLIENQTEDLCKKAVILEWISLKYVKNLAEDVCIVSLSRHLLAYKFIRDEYPSDKAIDYAVKRYYTLIANFKDSSIDTYIKDITQNISVILYINPKKCFDFLILMEK